MEFSNSQILDLHVAYFSKFPDDLPEWVTEDYKSIIVYKNLIRGCRPNIRLLNKLLDITIGLIRSKSRFQKYNLIRLIRYQVDISFINSTTIDKLFFVFKSLIIGANEETAWKLTMLIKDMPLSESDINWLIDEYMESEHIQNRLLRYPIPNLAISEWARQCLEEEELQNRVSELIGLQLNFNLNYKYDNKTAFIWGIHYSKIPVEIKKKLLVESLSSENINEVINVINRNNFDDLLKELYNSL